MANNNKKIEQIIEQLTLDEKVKLCSGKDFWQLESLEKFDIKSIMLTDGPNGLRRQESDADHIGLNSSVKATCFPAAVNLASTWNKEILNEVGQALGREAQSQNVSVLLGPGVNIKRSPLCGRNFEYYSEDPLLSSRLAKHYINGVQSQGVGTSLKHFAVNNHEHRRMTVNVELDERTLREIYLRAFEEAIKESQPATIMSAYNRVRGEYCSENTYLLQNILREEWGFEGLVVTDWGANNDRIAGLLAGLDLEMPSSGLLNDVKLIQALEKGEITEETLNATLKRLLKLMIAGQAALKVQSKQAQNKIQEENHELASQTAGESFVLLRNENNALPLNKNSKIALIGEFAENPRYQGGGSSHVNPSRLLTLKEELSSKIELTYSQGFKTTEDSSDKILMQEAIDNAKKSDTVVLCLGLPDRYESEGYDRKHMCLPQNQIELLEALVKVHSKVVVLLANGSPIEMPWLEKTQAVVESYLAGQAGASALADLLVGDLNPSGKLAESFPFRLEDNPSYLHFPGKSEHVYYAEGLFVGYRYYLSKKMPVLFPFGHGLSYTQFSYEKLSLAQPKISCDESCTLSVTIKNTGSLKGKEIVQLYVEEKNPSVVRPVKELKGFEKIELEAGQEKQLDFVLSFRDFAYFDEEQKDWVVNQGDFLIHVGASSEDIRLSETVNIITSNKKKKKLTMNTTPAELVQYEAGKAFVEKMMQGMQELNSDKANENPNGEPNLMQQLLFDAPLRTIISFAKGGIDPQVVQGVLDLINAE